MNMFTVMSKGVNIDKYISICIFFVITTNIYSVGYVHVTSIIRFHPSPTPSASFRDVEVTEIVMSTADFRNQLEFRMGL